MTLEDQHIDQKSLRIVTGKTADWEALARDCVCFNNGAGGRLLFGIEDGEALPPAGQTVPPEWLRGAQLDHKTTLSRTSPHRLVALILEDLARYPNSSSTDINRRIGVEISAKTVKRALYDLVDAGRVAHAGEHSWRRYRLSDQERKGHEAGEFS
ncbi:MAG: hypothetical protein IPH73_13870 [Rhodocyclales bacterium]|nr:hypothetical protein [Rhodocyclales bacterium]